jgi:hypothetical protein
MADGIEALLDERTDFFNQWDGAGPLAFRALVDEPAGAWCCLPPDRPGPGVAVNVGAPDAGHFTDPGGGARGEDYDIAPALEVIGRLDNERRGQVAERLPVGQRQCARVIELVFGALVIALPAHDAGGISVHDPVSDRLFHDPDQNGQAVLDRRTAALLGDPAVDSAVHRPVGDHP